MFTPVEAFVGWRYTRARRRTHFVSFISGIAMLGVALGVTALITILSIMNGFERELRERILGVAAHVVVTAEGDRFEAWQEVADVVRQQSAVTAAAPYIRREAMLTHYDNVHGALIRGIDPLLEGAVSVIPEKIVEGSMTELTAGAFNIVLGVGLATTIQARVGSQVTLVSPQPMRTAAGMVPRLRRYNVIGIFEAGVHQFDTAMALVHIEDAQRMFRYGDSVTGVRMKLADPFASSEFRHELSELFEVDARSWVVTDWTQTNVNLFKALKTEKMVMFVILMLTVAVAAFNLISTLVMVVEEKVSDIAILQTIGMTRRNIVWIFFIHGAFIGFAGIVAGSVFGVLLAQNVDTLVAAAESFFRFKILSPEVYYISEIPSVLKGRDVFYSILFASLLCVCAPLYPALLAGRTAPAAALRYD